MNKEIYDVLVSLELGLEREQEFWVGGEKGPTMVEEAVHSALAAVRRGIQDVIDDAPL